MAINGSPAVLGVYLGHDLGACILVNGTMVACIEEERLNRYKHGRPNTVAGLWPRFAGKFGYFPWASVCYCLDAAKLSIDDLDLIAVGDDLWGSGAADTIASVIPVRDKRKVVYVREPMGAAHHFHHALASFFWSSFDDAAVLVVDGDGNSTDEGYEAETGFAFFDRHGRNRLVFKNRYRDRGIPRSGIGWMYEQVTLLLGFANREIFLADAGKTMGLSAYGAPRSEFKRPWVKKEGFRLDFSAFHCWLRETGHDQRMLSYQGGLATRDAQPSQYASDLALKAQVELESALLHLVQELRRETGLPNLCLSGGVALNAIANALIVRNRAFEHVFVCPAPHDGGQAVGIACHGHMLLNGQCPETTGSAGKVAIRPFRHAYAGRDYAPEEIHAALDAAGVEFVELGTDGALVDQVSDDLSERRIVGWFAGGSEIGPRALGHRSILANPDTAGMKDRLNALVKFREGFRPFAPSVLEERASEIFDVATESPFMLLIVPVHDAWKDRIPAVVHVDGTARIQTVSSRTDPLFYALIRAFEKRTGMPLVLNTSFNLKGMPIVETPTDALKCFLATEMDTLYLGRFKISQPRPSAICIQRTPGWEFTTEVSEGNDVKLTCYEAGVARLSCRVTRRVIALLQSADGETSVEVAWQRSAGARDEPIDQALRTLKALARANAIGLRAGNLSVGGRRSAAPWWQTAVPEGPASPAGV